MTAPALTGPDGVIRRPAGTTPLADSADGRYVCAFEVPSSSTPGKCYKVALDTAQSCWVCECIGNIHHGHCRHLKQYGLRGRRETQALIEAANVRLRPFNLQSGRPAPKLQPVLTKAPRVEPAPASAKPFTPSAKLAAVPAIRAISLDEDV